MSRATAGAVLALLAVAAVGCGDDGSQPDAGNPTADAPGFPAPPALGAQLDRRGRAEINLLLDGLLATSGVAAMREAYDRASDPATWATTILGASDRTIAAELAANLAILDVLDQRVGTAGSGCGNQPLYNATHPGAPTTPAADSYAPLAALFADDQLFVDTAKTSCTQYLALELEVVSGGDLAHMQCGGRAPSQDVIDATYSLLAAGLEAGFTPGTAGNLSPRLGDGVGKHGDVSDTAFPFLGEPH